MEHWQQNIADDEYTLAKTEPMTGTTGEETAAKAEETEGFTAKEFAQAKIAPDGSTVIKIHYDRKTITLIFYAENGEDKTTVSGKFGAEIVSPSPEKTDFIFTGWSTKQTPDESSKSYNGKEKITLIENLTLYAQWEEISYKINYELNGGTNASENPATFKKGDSVTLTEPTYEYFDFCGWYLTQDFSGEAITGWNVGEKTGDITLYAKWTVKAENVVNAIKNLTEGAHTVCVAGEIDEATVKNIGKALSSNENAKVNLDLSGTAGFENIPSWAFKNCTSLINIKIPTSVTRIGGGAFWECTNLTDVEIPKGVTSIGDIAFVGCHNVTSLYIEDDNKYYQAFNNCIYTKDGQTLICVLGNPTSISFLQTITSIGNNAFNGCISLTNVEIPESVTSIDWGAFVNCKSLKNIKIPENVISIENSAFDRCINLTDIKLPTKLKSIGDWAFTICTSLTNIKIPTSVTNIGDGAFDSCVSLTNIEIPENVTMIGRYVFHECSNLTTVNYMGTIEKWKKIDIDEEWNDSLLTAKIICTDGIINE